MSQPPPVPPPRFITRHSNVEVHHGSLPHWEPSAHGAVFLTLRLGDSLPQEKIAPLMEAKRAWLEAHPQPWSALEAMEYAQEFEGNVEDWLDAGFGSCVLDRQEAREIVEATLRYYAETRFTLYSFVVMPNHLHLLIMPREGETIGKIVQSFKRYTSHQLVGLQTWPGLFWQAEYWDTHIRDEAHFQRALRYIKRNDPQRAYSVYDTH